MRGELAKSDDMIRETDRLLAEAIRIPADHACYACHSDYTMFADVDDKIRTIGLICVSS